MRTEIKEIKIYKFAELSEGAKQKAIENLSYINTDFEWFGSTIEDAKQIGLKIDEFDLDRNKHAKGYLLLAANEVAQNIISEHGEMCETFKTAVNFMNEWNPIFNDYMNEDSEHYESKESEDSLKDLENDFLRYLLEDYATILQKECEYLQSKEAIIETIETNDYEFTEDGKLY